MIKGIALSIILTVIIALFFVVDFYFMSRYDKDRSEGGKGWAWSYTLFVIVIGLAILLQPVLLPNIAWNTDSPLGFFIQCIGGVSVLLSFVLHIWSRIHLRHYYTERVEVQANHQVINTGPYAYVRHPFITSVFLIAGGIFLLNPAITTFLMFLYAIWGFTKAAREEEQLLSNEVAGYIEYLNQTARFFPKLWSKK